MTKITEKCQRRISIMPEQEIQFAPLPPLLITAYLYHIMSGNEFGKPLNFTLPHIKK